MIVQSELRELTFGDLGKTIPEHTDFTYWRESEQALGFQNIFAPPVIHMDYQLPDLENGTRNHGVTLGQVASRATDALELRKASLVMRAQSYRRRMFADFDKVRGIARIPYFRSGR